MKKNFLLLTLFLSFISLSKINKNDIKLELNSNVETNLRGGIDDISIKYIPLDLKIKTKDDKFIFFFKTRGERYDIKNPNETYRHEKTKPNPIIKDATEDLDYAYEGEPYTETFDIVHFLNKDHYHNPHEHDDLIEGHSHGFFEDIEENDKHEHHHDPNILDLENYTNTTPILENDDVQFKLGVQYKPDQYSKYKLTLFPFSYNGDERRYHNSFVLDIDKTKLFNKNLALIIKPKFTTYDFYKPALIKNRLYLKYELKKDTVITGYLYNAFQLNNLEEKYNFKNSLNFTYDYNTEEEKGYKFYKILDHEHKKIDQIKFDLRIAHEGNYLLNPLKDRKTKFDILINKFNTTLKFNYKKTNFFIKDLIFSNDTSFDSFVTKMTTNNRKYNVTPTLYSEEDIDENEIGEIWDNINDRKFKHLNKDKSIYEDYYYSTKDGKKYLFIYQGKSTNPDSYESSIIENIINFNNLTKINYKNLEFKNNFELATELSKDKVIIYNEAKLNYKFNLKNNFYIKPELTYLFAPVFVKEKGVPIIYNINKLSFDFNKKLDKKDIKALIGLFIEGGIQTRKVTKDYVDEGNEKEADKWIKGYQLIIKPHLDTEYSITKNLKLKTKFEIPFLFGKNALSVLEGNKFEKVEDKFYFKTYNILLNFGINYKF